MTTSKQVPVKVKEQFTVGALVWAAKKKLIYMLVQSSNTKPYQAVRGTGSGTLSGVCVWSEGGCDSEGDPLPPVGYLHHNLGEQHLLPYLGGIELQP